MDVAQERGEIPLLLNQERLVAALEEVTDPEKDGVDAEFLRSDSALIPYTLLIHRLGSSVRLRMLRNWLLGICHRLPNVSLA